MKSFVLCLILGLALSGAWSKPCKDKSKKGGQGGGAGQIPSEYQALYQAAQEHPEIVEAVVDKVKTIIEAHGGIDNLLAYINAFIQQAGGIENIIDANVDKVASGDINMQDFLAGYPSIKAVVDANPESAQYVHDKIAAAFEEYGAEGVKEHIKAGIEKAGGLEGIADKLKKALKYYSSKRVKRSRVNRMKRSTEDSSSEDSAEAEEFMSKCKAHPEILLKIKDFIDQHGGIEAIHDHIASAVEEAGGVEAILDHISEQISSGSFDVDAFVAEHPVVAQIVQAYPEASQQFHDKVAAAIEQYGVEGVKAHVLKVLNNMGGLEGIVAKIKMMLAQMQSGDQSMMTKRSAKEVENSEIPSEASDFMNACHEHPEILLKIKEFIDQNGGLEAIHGYITNAVEEAGGIEAILDHFSEQISDGTFDVDAFLAEHPVVAQIVQAYPEASQQLHGKVAAAIAEYGVDGVKAHILEVLNKLGGLEGIEAKIKMVIMGMQGGPAQQPPMGGSRPGRGGPPEEVMAALQTCRDHPEVLEKIQAIVEEHGGLEGIKAYVVGAIEEAGGLEAVLDHFTEEISGGTFDVEAFIAEHPILAQIVQAYPNEAQEFHDKVAAAIEKYGVDGIKAHLQEVFQKLGGFEGLQRHIQQFIMMCMDKGQGGFPGAGPNHRPPHGFAHFEVMGQSVNCQCTPNIPHPEETPAANENPEADPAANEGPEEAALVAKRSAGASEDEVPTEESAGGMTAEGDGLCGVGSFDFHQGFSVNCKCHIVPGGAMPAGSGSSSHESSSQEDSGSYEGPRGRGPKGKGKGKGRRGPA